MFLQIMPHFVSSVAFSHVDYRNKFTVHDSTKYNKQYLFVVGMGTEDIIEMNASSFMKEMKEMAFIIRNASSRSLIVIGKFHYKSTVSVFFLSHLLQMNWVAARRTVMQVNFRIITTTKQ